MSAKLRLQPGYVPAGTSSNQEFFEKSLGEIRYRRRKRVAKYWLELKPLAKGVSVIESSWRERNWAAARSNRHWLRNSIGPVFTSSRAYFEKAVIPMLQ